MIDFRTQLRTLKHSFIIGIAGDSGSGKTTYSNGIRRLLGHDLVKTITMDGYHKENRKQRYISGKLPLDPLANNLDFLFEHLKKLKQGKSVEIPIYNHTTGDFSAPMLFTPPPIIILEGLHALYPDFLPFIDFSIYVDPCRDIKWKWKYERDVKKRGHPTDVLTHEMLKREAAYKRWIDFQKTDANIVIKIHPTRMHEFARYELIGDSTSNCYNVELIIEPAESNLPTIPLPFDIDKILDITQPPFLLSAVPSLYWGKKVNVVQIDGLLSEKTVETLERHIASLTGIEVDKVISSKEVTQEAHEKVSAVQFAQLLITWRFLELIYHRMVQGVNVSSM